MVLKLKDLLEFAGAGKKAIAGRVRSHAGAWEPGDGKDDVSRSHTPALERIAADGKKSIPIYRTGHAPLHDLHGVALDSGIHPAGDR